ncbi:Uncharacterized protein FWK35_00007948 [Aphis craccivora]|uniref:Uncharacterized protein n=1 Tax=Aphis craccivora TaxID=307492 RepID=A0A6G0ZN35_APHCR|nr:Uncharacterized protein FWK35_00007948 [Aphis craccivora]
MTTNNSRLPRNRFWTVAAALVAVTAALLTGRAAEAASTGLDMAAVGGSNVAVVDAVPAESKKVAGKSALMDGYVRTGSTKGDKGYNEDDVYGDKDSDSFGFGTQVSYGSKAGDGGNGAYHESSAYDDNGRSNPKYSAWHFEEKDGKPTKRYVYDSLNDGAGKKKKYDPLAVEAEASEYDSVEAYDDGDDGGTHAGYEVDDAEPEYGNLYDSADVYNDADTYY